MPPSGPGKRKRYDQSHSHDDGTRPSPHRPGHLDLARQNQPQSPTAFRDGYDGRGRGYRSSSRGGRGNMYSSNTSTNPPIESQPLASRPPLRATPAPLPIIKSSTPDHVPSEHLPIRVYDYQLLTEKVRQEWNGEGKEVVREKAKLAAQDRDDLMLTALVQEIIHAVCAETIPAHEAGEVLRDALAVVDDQHLSVARTTLLDTVSIFSEDVQTLPAQALATLLIATGVDQEILRLELDQPLLLKLGLISGRFKQMSIRKTTNLLYRQANFNLMREESEGFAKMITELFTTSGNELPTGDVIHQTVEKIKAMIGAFDLDVGRSLDVVLDVFGSVLVRHFRFLVKLLRASPWWPQMLHQHQGLPSKSPGLPAWAQPDPLPHEVSLSENDPSYQPIDAQDEDFWRIARETGLLAFQQIGRVSVEPQALQQAQSSANTDIETQWIRETRTLPPIGNRDAAQLLGFKLRFYSSSTARDPNENLPDNLIHLSALLIKIGFISLNDLYPHIWRSDEEMEELRQVKMNEKLERERAARPGAGARNALAMAGALADDTVPAPVARLREPATRSTTPLKDIEPSKNALQDQSHEPSDQKVTLLKSLLAIGALPESLFILGRFPWIIDLYPEVPEYIFRILHHCLSRVYSQVRPLRTRQSVRVARPTPETDVPGVPKGQVRLVDATTNKTLKWANLDRDDSGDGTDYRFYWDDWNDNIPICHNIDDVFTLCRTLLTLVGVKIGQDPSLVLKLTRIGKYSLSIDTNEANRARWLDLTKRILLPSLSLTKSNAGVINEIFELMSQFSATTRFVMYLEWSNGRTSRNPDMKAAFDQAKAETKDILKRISKTNIKPMARALAKIAYANPHIVITTALAQIEVYDSIASVFVEGARYFTDLGYDVLTWAMISSMARAGRSRTQDGGMFASKWLTALSQFAGKIYKRYSMMKPGPILQYVAHQLEQGNSTDLKMLEQVINAMAGIPIEISFNDAQLLALGGGPLLQAQTLLSMKASDDKGHDPKTSSRRLLKALHDHGLTAKFLVSIAQQRQACVFEEGDVPLKAIGNTFDEISRTFVQYLDLLRTNLAPDEFESMIPDLGDLLIKYQLPAEIAFSISRPIITKKIADIEKENAEAQKVNGIKAGNADVNMDDQEASEEDGEAIEVDDVPTAAASPSDLETNTITMPEEYEHGLVVEQWHPVLQPLMERLNEYVSDDIIKLIGVGFYVTFWQLSLYDIHVPSKAYEDEMTRQKKRITAITADRSSVSASNARQREAQIKEKQQAIDELLKENRQHVKAYSESRTRLSREKDQWFANKQRKAEQINTALMEHCFLPRILVSPQDAFFCFRFLKFLHTNNTPNFRTLGFYDIMLKPTRLISLCFMCTWKESENLGKFLRELLQDLSRWHHDKAIYEREAFGSKKNLIGFAMKVENGKAAVLLDFESFRRLLFKWHSVIHSALIQCLASPEYMHARNAITILSAISPVFPAVKFHGKELLKAVDNLQNGDREDLKVSSKSLYAALSQREKDWILPASFRQGQEKVDPETPAISRVHSSSQPASGEVVESTQEINEIQAKSEGTMPSRRRQEESKPSADRSRSAIRNGEIPREAPMLTVPDTTPNSSRPVSDGGRHERRAPRSADQDRVHGLPRRLSPSRQTPPVNLPGRPENDGRNGYRDSPRSNRTHPQESARSDSRLGYLRQGQSDRGPAVAHDLSHRHSRSAEKPSSSEQDERPHRREHDHRPTPDDRRPVDRDVRTDRESRSERDNTRSERDLRVSERDHGRLHHDSERRKPDLIDERRPGPSTLTRVPAQITTGSINPQRAALINDTELRPESRLEARSDPRSESRSGLSIRGQAQDKPRGSRISSPKREDETRFANRSEPSERPERLERFDRRAEVNSRPTHPPSQPGARPGTAAGYNHDSRYQPPQVDMQHGRLEPESPQRQIRSERQIDPEVPSGPRHRAQLSSRGRGPPSSGQVIALDRPTPTGPSRHSRNSSAQDAPVTSSEAPGVHPDRMNQIAAADAPRAPQRSSQIPPPLGPRNAQGASPSGPNPAPRGPPTGPQVDGIGRGRRNQIDTLNTTLAQAQSPSGRGRGGIRQSNGPSAPQMPPSGPGPRPQVGPIDNSNPNGMPVHPRPPSRRDSSKSLRHEHEGRQVRNRAEPHDEPRYEDPRRLERRDEQPRESRAPRLGPNEELPPRKHPREEGPHYGYSRGGGRSISDNKRTRRGG